MGFRAFTQRVGIELGLKGWVRNLSDGRVEALAKGLPSILRRFEKRLRQGPPQSVVDAVTAVELDPPVDNLVEFEVRKDALQPWSEN